MTRMMKCGHTSNAVNGRGDPVCIICLGIVSGADEVDENPPDFAGRVASCSYCRREQPSSNFRKLAFFEYRPSYKTDSYYCGCRGWD